MTGNLTYVFLGPPQPAEVRGDEAYRQCAELCPKVGDGEIRRRFEVG